MLTRSCPIGQPGGAPYTEPNLGVGVVVGIAIIAFLVLAIVLDITCFFCRDCGLTAALVRRVATNDKDKEAMIEAGKNNRSVAGECSICS